MYNIEYDIKLNDSGRPCIDLPKEHESIPEDKFFAIELARYILQSVYSRQSDKFDSESSKNMETCLNVLGQVGDELAVLLWENMKFAGDAAMLMNSKYHIQVDNIENRNKLIGEYICYNGKLFKRKNGIKVLVTDEMKIYELNNNDWTEV